MSAKLDPAKNWFLRNLYCRFIGHDVCGIVHVIEGVRRIKFRANCNRCHKNSLGDSIAKAVYGLEGK
jgi:hypothetical protein